MTLESIDRALTSGQRLTREQAVHLFREAPLELSLIHI